MPRQSDPDELQLASQVADGTPIDWAGAEKIYHGSPNLLVGLKRVAAIVAAHSGADETETLRVPEPAGGTWGHLRILELLGRGGYGEVYRANDPSLQTDVALKLLRADRSLGDDTKERFLTEARRLAQVRHPNVLVVHGVATHEGRAGIWTELVRGQTLESYLERHGPLAAREAALIGVDVCRALAAVHAVGLIHRDVKPGNVMREEGGRIVLMDFGSMGHLPPPGSVARGEHAYGTPLLMAPEQLAGEVAGPATDIYGVGALLYRLATGAFPIEASTYAELLERHARGEAVRLRDRRADLPSAFVHVVERALDPDPTRRPATAGAMERALLDAVASTGMAAEAPVEVEAPPKPPRPIGRGVVWAALLLFAAVGMWAVIRSAQPRKGDGTNSYVPPPAAGVPVASATVYREYAGGADALLPGASVKLGDRLYLDFRAEESLHVYVFNEDERAALFVLFPIPDVDLANPIPAGRHRLPGNRAGRAQSWEISSVGIKENFVVLASRAPLAAVERELATLPAASRAGPHPLSPRVIRELRGIGTITDRPERAAPPTGRLSDLIGAAAGARTIAPGIWTWQIELRNPGTGGP